MQKYYQFFKIRKGLIYLIIALSFYSCSKKSSNKSSYNAATADDHQLESARSIIHSNTAGSLILGSGTRVDLQENHGLKIGDEISLEEVATPQGAISDGVQSKGNTVHFGVKQAGKSLSSLPSPVSLSISIQNSQFALATQLSLVDCPVKALEDLCIFYVDDSGKNKSVYTKKEYSLSCASDKFDVKFLTSKTGYFTPASCNDNEGKAIATKALYTPIPNPSLKLVSEPPIGWISSDTLALISETSFDVKCTIDGFIKVLDSDSNLLMKKLISSNIATKIKVLGNDLKILGQGSHELKILCESSLGKVSTENVSVKIGLDNSPPTTASSLAIAVANPVASPIVDVTTRLLITTDSRAASNSTTTYNSKLSLSWINAKGDALSGLKSTNIEIFRDANCATASIYNSTIVDDTTTLEYDDGSNFKDGVSYSFRITTTDQIGLRNSVCSDSTSLDLSKASVVNVTSPNTDLYPGISAGMIAPWSGTFTPNNQDDDVIIITVQFSKPVFVSISDLEPTLTLRAGTSSIRIPYYEGSGTDTLSFKYDVGASQENESTPAVSYLGTDSLSANSSQIIDRKGIPANLTLPSPGEAGSLNFNKQIHVQTP